MAGVFSHFGNMEDNLESNSASTLSSSEICNRIVNVFYEPQNIFIVIAKEGEINEWQYVTISCKKSTTNNDCAEAILIKN